MNIYYIIHNPQLENKHFWKETVLKHTSIKILKNN